MARRYGSIPVKFLTAKTEPHEYREIMLQPGMTVTFAGRTFLDKAIEQFNECDYTIEVNYENNSIYIVSDKGSEKLVEAMFGRSNNKNG